MIDLSIAFDVLNRHLALASERLRLWAKLGRKSRNRTWRDGIVAKRKRAKSQRQARLIRRRFA